MEERDDAVVHGLAEGMIEHLNRIVDDADKFVRRTINELYDKVKKRLTALEEKIAATLPKGRREFQFARERDTSEIPTCQPVAAPPRDQLTSLDRRKCRTGWISWRLRECSG